MGDTREVATALHRAALGLLRGLRRQDVEMGLGTARASALSVIVFRGPIGIGELARIEQVRAPTMTRLVDRLQRDGLVVRERDPEDRRHVRVRATPRGVRLMHAGRERRVRALEKEVAKLSAGDLETLERAAAIIGSLSV